jgi:hypothetical protein
MWSLNKMMRSVIILSVFFLSFYSRSAAMEPMNDHSMQKVKGDSGIPHENKYANGIEDETAVNHTDDANYDGAHPKDLSDDSQEIQTLKQHNDYFKFLLLLNKLEKISERRNYGKVTYSKEFLALCARTANVFKAYCKDPQVLQNQDEKENTRTLVNARKELLKELTLFYNRIAQHQKEKRTPPDLKKLVTHIRSRQHVFETEYARQIHVNNHDG